MTLLHLCHLKKRSIWEQLELEEALLRADDRNWCIINEGSPPAIVMGISGNVDELVHKDKLVHSPIPIIRRFSGGGTVVIDEKTLFVTFIFQKSDVDLGQCPRKIMQWTEALYRPVFHPEDFSLIETDYVLGKRKIGGNAQYMTKSRWLHHTSFLWDYNDARMSLLKMPPKAPEYRKEREHHSFVDRLKNYYSSIDILTKRLVDTLHRHFEIISLSENEDMVSEVRQRPHRKALSLVVIHS